MSKYWQVGNRDDTLVYNVFAPNKEMATKVVEDLMGPISPSRRLVTELPGCPEGYGYVVEGSSLDTVPPQILTNTEEGE